MKRSDVAEESSPQGRVVVTAAGSGGVAGGGWIGSLALP